MGIRETYKILHNFIVHMAQNWMLQDGEVFFEDDVEIEFKGVGNESATNGEVKTRTDNEDHQLQEAMDELEF